MRCRYCKEEIELDGMSKPSWIHSPTESGIRWYTCRNHFRENNRSFKWAHVNWEAEPDMEYETVGAILTKYDNGGT